MEHVFVSGNPALDLAGTRKWRRGPDPEELLRTPSDLREWLAQSGLVTVLPGVSPTGLARALEVREAIYALALARCTGLAPAPPAVRVLNAAAAPAPLRPSIDAGRLVVTGSLPALLSTLTRAAFDVALDDRAPLKECARHPCTRIFIDRSRGGRRNWCGMNECGARVKVAAYRERHRAGTDQ